MKTLRKDLDSAVRQSNHQAKTLMQQDNVLWYVLLIMSGKEYLAHQLLTRMQCVAFLPVQRKWHRVNRYRREKVKTSYPAIPGCLFIGFTKGTERWLEIFSLLSSAYGVLGYEGRPEPISGKRILHFLEHNQNAFEPEKETETNSPPIASGESARITTGPLQGHVVNVAQMKGKKAGIVLELFGKKEEVYILVDKLERIS